MISWIADPIISRVWNALKVKENIYLIAVNPFDKSGSKLLDERESVGDEDVDRELVLAQFNFDDFVGQGYEICLCTQIPEEESDEFSIVLNINGEKKTFEFSALVVALPIIEGEFAPGIYRLDGHKFYRIETNFEISRILTDLEGFFIDYEKLLCRPDGLEFRSPDSGDLLSMVERLPLTFFDLSCPVCGQKVITHQKSETDSICQIIENKCAHYIGAAICSGGGYEPQELAELKISHQIESDNFYFEVLPNNWKQALLYQPSPELGASWWRSAKGSIYENHFFFMDPNSEGI